MAKEMKKEEQQTLSEVYDMKLELNEVRSDIKEMKKMMKKMMF